jgi:hypothetical protein
VPVVTNVVSPKIHSPEGSGSGQIAHSKAAKKSALGVFGKLLAGLIRKTKGGEEAAAIAGEVPGTRGTGKTKTARDVREAGSLDGSTKLRSLQKNEANQGKDDVLSVLSGRNLKKNEAAAALSGKEKKTALQKDEKNEQQAIALRAEELSLQVLNQKLPEEAQVAEFSRNSSGEGSSDWDSLKENGQKTRNRDPIPEVTPPEKGSGENGPETFRLAQAVNKQAAAETQKKDAKSGTETKNAKKNRERFSLEVQDLRTVDSANTIVPGQ